MGARTGVPGAFQGMGPLKKDSPEKMTANERFKSEIGDIIFSYFLLVFGSKLVPGRVSGLETFLVRFLLKNDVE